MRTLLVFKDVGHCDFLDYEWWLGKSRVTHTTTNGSVSHVSNTTVNGGSVSHVSNIPIITELHMSCYIQYEHVDVIEIHTLYARQEAPVTRLISAWAVRKMQSQHIDHS